MSSSSSSSSIPSIRSFQMDSSSVGVLKNSVNLFRGDVNYTQTLFTLPGRNSNDGLDITISIQYQSNINQQAMTWNRNQPTGILGMGWAMPIPGISLNTNNSPTAGQHQYSINTSGADSQLIREPSNPFLFSMDGSLASQLVNAQPIPSDVRSQFVGLGLPLSTTAVIDGTTSPWTIQDDALEQAFLLALENGVLNAYDGGESYQLANYNFWKVLYYPRYECWKVVNSAGQISIYGGGVVTNNGTGYQSSTGNSIEWAVQWVDDTGEALWLGNSAAASNQQQYAKAWNLVRVYSNFGESISYAYNEFTRNSEGLLPNVEQLVATGGKPFTKACYLTSITDVFGRTVLFNYQPKLWSNDDPNSPREYADPHKSCALPDNTPNGFQDCYETYYLNNIIVLNTDGVSSLFSLQFNYNPSPNATGAEAVATVAPPAPGVNSGDLCKRLLTGFSLSNTVGQSLPGFIFNYYVNNSDVNPGALNSITWPTGGTALYTYQTAKLDICTRDYSMTPPSPMPATSMPRVWFGSGYAVVMWYNTTSEQLSMQIVTWNGQWKSWQADSSTPLLLDGGGTSLATVNVVTGDNFVAVYYNTGTGNEFLTNLHLFRKNPARPCQWVAATLPGGGTGGCNSPSYQWNQAQGTVSILAGNNFLLATQTNTSGQAITYDVITWQWFSQSWIVKTYSSNNYLWFAASSEYYVTLDMSSNLTLNYLSATGDWQSTSTNLGVTLYSYAAIQIEADASMVAIVNLTSGGAANSSYQDYTVYCVQWNSAYQFVTPVSAFSFHDPLNNYPTQWTPVIVNNTMVAVAGHLMRFDGQSWQQNDSLAPVTALSPNYQQRYTYGPDYAVMVKAENVGGVPAANLVAYDASVCYDNTWENVASTVISGITAPAYNDDTANWPSGGNQDYLTVGTQLFFRGTTTNWATAVTQSIADIQTLLNQAGGNYQVNAESMINQGPNFLAFSAYNLNESTATAVSALILQNGGVYGAAQFLDGEKLWTVQEQDGGDTGVYPAGTSCFYTYPDTANDLDCATSITLYYYAGSAIEGPISDWPVASIAINDGLSESSVTTYVQDTTTASCDASGTVIKYYQSTVYPAGTPTNPAYGSVVCQYLNGNANLLGDNYYNMMDGMLSSISCYDATDNLLTQRINNWIAYTQRAGSPTNGSAECEQLYGAYVLPASQQTILDGVSSTQTYGYCPGNLQYPYTGNPATVTSSYLNGSGVEETNIQNTTYACEAYTASNVLNNLSSQTGQNTSINGVTTNASVTTLQSWPSIWGDDVLVPAEEADFSWTGGDDSFPFASYQAGESPENWQCSTRILQYATDGSILMLENGVGIPQAVGYATTLGLPLITISGAAMAECAYDSFQSYEDQTAWISNGTEVCTSNAWFGQQSLSLPIGASLSTTVTPATGRSHYLLGYRYLTHKGYQGNGSGWTINAGGTQTTVAFEGTGGVWQYQTTTITLPTGINSITITASNGGNALILLDSVLLVPWGTGVNLLTWKSDTRLMYGSMTAAGDVSFILYDNYNRPLGAVGATGQLQELTTSFQTLQGVNDGTFNNASPNAGITVQMADGGFAETFVDGGQWQNRWLAGNSSLWTAGFHALSKPSTTADTLTWRVSCPATTESTAYFIEFTLPSSLNDGISIQFSGNQQIAWIPNQGWSWTDENGVSQQTPLANPPQVASQWLLVLTADKVLFFGDGQLLFSQAANIVNPAEFSLSTGSNALTINNLITGFNPRPGIVYGDGAARQRQFQQLHQNSSGTDSLMQEQVYDALDNQIAQTRTAPGSFGSGASVPTLQYRNSFVDVPAFLASLTNTWAMTGDIADYYAGQPEGVYNRSNDQGYPYMGQRYESSAQQRLLESGSPGMELAIHDIDTIPFAERQTSRVVYSSNTENTPMASAAANQYNLQTSYSPGGLEGQLFIDASNRAIATQMCDSQDSDNVFGQTQVSLSYSAASNNAATIASIKLPNAFNNSPQDNPQDFVRTITQNSLGQISALADPNAGNNQFLYDGNGLLRFVQVPLETGENYFLYSRYDALGRLVEEGVVNATWDEATLATQVNNLNYPAASDGAVPARVYCYDGDGSNPNDIGNMTQVTTYNPAPACDPSLGDCTVVEQWSYDELGRAISASITVSGAASQTATVNYLYNSLNQLTQIDFPDETSVDSIVYAYNDQGKIISISTPENSTAIVAYTWSADSQIISAQRGPLAEAWGYNSAGTINAHSVAIAGQTVFSQTYGYTPDSQIDSRTTSFAFTDMNDTSSVSYGYDNQQRLTNATVANGGIGNLNISQYDANGNIWNWQQDTEEFAAQYNPGTDQLSIATSKGQSTSFHYRKDGRPDQWRGMSIEYNLALGMTAAITKGDVTVRYARGMGNYRAVRQSGSDIRITFQAAGHVPLIIWDNGKPQICIWGMNGLEAVNNDGALQYPIADHQGTVWAVTDVSGNLIASYQYGAFGNILSPSGSAPSTWLFQYGGKEWDSSIGLYDYSARLYDPILMRFLTPDTAMQFASPYVFVGNNPLNMVDPSGNISKGWSIFVSCLLVVVGVVASIATDGLADAALATEETATWCAKAGKKTVKILVHAACGAAIGAGTQGLEYDISSGANFSSAAWRKALGSGAASGSVSACIGGVGQNGGILSAVSDFAKSAVESAGIKMFRTIACNFVGDVLGNIASTLITDACNHEPVTGKQIGISAAMGAACGLIGGAAGCTETIGAPSLGAPSGKGTLGKVLYTVGTVLVQSGWACGATALSNSSSASPPPLTQMAQTPKVSQTPQANQMLPAIPPSNSAGLLPANLYLLTVYQNWGNAVSSGNGSTGAS